MSLLPTRQEAKLIALFWVRSGPADVFNRQNMVEATIWELRGWSQEPRGSPLGHASSGTSLRAGPRSPGRMERPRVDSVVETGRPGTLGQPRGPSDHSRQPPSDCDGPSCTSQPQSHGDNNGTVRSHRSWQRLAEQPRGRSSSLLCSKLPLQH